MRLGVITTKVSWLPLLTVLCLAAGARAQTACVAPRGSGLAVQWIDRGQDFDASREAELLNGTGRLVGPENG